MNLYLKVLWRFVVYGLLLIGGVSLYTFLTYMRPSRHITGVSPADLGMGYEDISLRTADNVSLAGWFIPAKNNRNAAIIVCHGYPADKGDVLSLAGFLHEDFHLLFFDFRAMGKSEGVITTFGWKEQKDFNVAVEYLKSRGIETIGAFGFSMGAAVIIMANNADVDVIVADSSYASLTSLLDIIYRNFGILRHPFVFATRLWSRIFLKIDIGRVSPKDYIDKITVPILLIHSEKDSQIPVEHAHILKKSNPNAELWIIDKADHGEAQLLNRNQYKNRISNFFLRR